MNGRKGFQKGNQYARKHGFYSNVLDEAQKASYEQAICVEGLDQEIALIRVKIKSIIEHDPDNSKLIIQAITTLARLLRTKYNIGKKDKKGTLEAIGNVLRDIVWPLGFNKNQITIGLKK